MKIHILRNGGWVEDDISAVKKKDLFRIIPSEHPPGVDDNPLGEDIFRAKSDAIVEASGKIYLNIEKPFTLRFSSSYLDLLKATGLTIEVNPFERGYFTIRG